MPTRRAILVNAVTAGFSASAFAGQHEPFDSFLNGVRAQARQSGISAMTLNRALTGLSPNQRVLDRDRHQPEFSITWTRYRALVVTDKRITDGKRAVAANLTLLQQVERRYGVSAGVIAGIWGLESSFGAGMGDFHVIEALSTLAWDGRRASFFRGELLAALRILDQGDIAPATMTGSYAGAMGQPQFMPSSYLRYAVDFEGHGRRDIWTNKADVLGSIGNYLSASGWHGDDPWGQAVTTPIDVPMPGREIRRTVSEWARTGVRPVGNRWAASDDTQAALLAPDGPGGETFLAFANFAAIRRYNPSDYYAIAVGLIGDQVLI